jgi:glycerol kinase
VPTLLALDQGTTSSRAIVFDETGSVVALAQREFTQHFPHPGWVEHDAEEIWATQAAVAVEALARAGLAARDIAAVGIANQRETTVVWERAGGRPIAPAIVWQDRRTAETCAALRASGAAAELRRRTGLLADPYFSATKIAWQLDTVPGARARAEAGELAFGTIDSWLAWRLTGGATHVTDASNASRTLLFDLSTGGWDARLCELLRVPPPMLPRIVDSSGVLGTVTTIPELSGVPLAALIGDQQGALAGQACFSPGLAKNTYGTGCFLLVHAGDSPPTPPPGLLATVAARRGGRLSYALEGSVFIGGALVQWLRDQLGLIERTADIEALAAAVPDSGGVVLVPAFAGLGAPHWDTGARGLICGLTRGTTRAHIARAALEAIALQVADLTETMAASGVALQELRVDGGAAANDLLLQIQADLLQIPVLRPRCLETTALGAAYLAGMAVGVWQSPADIAHHWTLDRRFEPQRPPAQAAAQRAHWREAVERTRSRPPAAVG